MSDELADIQSDSDERGIPLRQAGIKGLRYPITVWDRSANRQDTVGTFKLTDNPLSPLQIRSSPSNR